MSPMYTNIQIFPHTSVFAMQPCCCCCWYNSLTLQLLYTNWCSSLYVYIVWPLLLFLLPLYVEACALHPCVLCANKCVTNDFIFLHVGIARLVGIDMAIVEPGNFMTYYICTCECVQHWLVWSVTYVYIPYTNITQHYTTLHVCWLMWCRMTQSLPRSTEEFTLGIRILSELSSKVQ